MDLRILLTIVVIHSSAVAQSTWVNKTPTTQPVRTSTASLVYNGTTKKIMLFGNWQKTETWDWDGSKWTRLSQFGPSVGYSHKMVWDSKRKRVILVGNTRPMQIHSWNGVSWSKITTKTSPPPRAEFNMAYDVKRDIVVLYGGKSSRTFSDTWEYDGTDWKQISSGGAPRRLFFGMDYDSFRGETILFGGEGVSSGSSVTLGDTWAWDGRSWVEYFGIPGPSGRARPSTAFDSVRNVLVLFGGWTAKGWTPDTWEWNGTKWTQITPALSPTSGGQMAFDPVRKVVVIVSELLSNSATETWEYVSRPPVLGSYASFGTGCAGSSGTPKLTAVGTNPPKVGKTFTVELTNIKNAAFVRAFGIVGASKSNWMGIPLPLDLRPFGMPGCNLLASMDILANLTVSGSKATWSFQIPNNPNLAGSLFYLQGLVFEPGANTAGAIVSNAGAGKIGL